MVQLGGAAAGSGPSPRGRVKTAPESEAPRPSGQLLSPPGEGGSSSTKNNKLFSPRLRISASKDDDAPMFDRPVGREAAEDTPLTKREPLSSPPVRPLGTPPQLAPAVPPRTERPSPPAPGLMSSRSQGGPVSGSRIEKASVVHRQPKHFLPAPVPRPNQLDDGAVPLDGEGSGSAGGAPQRPPRPGRAKTGLV
jgi:hypothetical protein